MHWPNCFGNRHREVQTDLKEGKKIKATLGFTGGGLMLLWVLFCLFCFQICGVQVKMPGATSSQDQSSKIIKCSAGLVKGLHLPLILAHSWHNRPQDISLRQKLFCEWTPGWTGMTFEILPSRTCLGLLKVPQHHSHSCCEQWLSQQRLLLQLGAA